MGRKLKYDVSGVDASDRPLAEPGMYRAKINEINEKTSKNGNEMLEVVLQITTDSRGKRTKFKGSLLWTYILTDHEASAFRLREFVDAVGKRAKGTMDLDAIVGTELQVNVKADKDLDDNYRPRVAKLLALPKDDDEDDEDDEEPEEEPEPDEDDDEEEESDDEDDDEEDDEDYSEWSMQELKDELKERGLKTGGKKSVLVRRLEKDDEAEDDGDDPF